MERRPILRPLLQFEPVQFFHAGNRPGHQPHADVHFLGASGRFQLPAHWFLARTAPAADACKKAFITNRLGDFGFLIGIIMVWAAAGSLNFGLLEKAMQEQPELLGASAGLIGLLLFCGAMGKSAQFPLHVWLPDAMEGPTPVSALIHAATMVAAGIVHALPHLLFSSVRMPLHHCVDWRRDCLDGSGDCPPAR